LRKLGEKVGFSVEEHKLSEDGANITVFFQKNAEASNNQAIKIPANAERIISIVKNHNAFKHYLTKWPYKRFITRMSRMIQEKLETANFESGKKLLDKLYAS
jgi:hypothetical protein